MLVVRKRKGRYQTDYANEVKSAFHFCCFTKKIVNLIGYFFLLTIVILVVGHSDKDKQ